MCIFKPYSPGYILLYDIVFILCYVAAEPHPQIIVGQGPDLEWGRSLGKDPHWDPGTQRSPASPGQEYPVEWILLALCKIDLKREGLNKPKNADLSGGRSSSSNNSWSPMASSSHMDSSVAMDMPGDLDLGKHSLVSGT